MEDLSISQIFLSFLSLTFLEIILGIDNLIFIQIATEKISLRYQKKVRRFGLGLGLVLRLLILISLSYLIHLTSPLFAIKGIIFSWKDLILMGGGLFLIIKSTFEIWNHLKHQVSIKKTSSSHRLAFAILQIAFIDVIFSFDSLLTAIGMTTHLGVIIAALVVSMSFMIFSADFIGDFLHRQHRLKILTLMFLNLIGFSLISQVFDLNIPKGYLYFALFFSISVECLNLLETNQHLKVKNFD